MKEKGKKAAIEFTNAVALPQRKWQIHSLLIFVRMMFIWLEPIWIEEMGRRSVVLWLAMNLTDSNENGYIRWNIVSLDVDRFIDCRSTNQRHCRK